MKISKSSVSTDSAPIFKKKISILWTKCNFISNLIWLVKQSLVENNVPFVWVKTQNNAQEDVWEKQKVSTGKHLDCWWQEFTALFIQIEDFDYSGLDFAALSKLEFAEKRLWFKKKNEAKRINWMKGCDYLKVDRAKLLESSISAIKNCDLHKVSFSFDCRERKKSPLGSQGDICRRWKSQWCRRVDERMDESYSQRTSQAWAR